MILNKKGGILHKSSVIKDYYFRRQIKGSFRYRLQRRSFEVSQSINRNFSANHISLLDIGTADGLMLEHLSHSIYINKRFFVGIDISFEMLNANPNKSFYPIQADVFETSISCEFFRYHYSYCCYRTPT